MNTQTAHTAGTDVLDNLLEGCQIIDFEWKYYYLNDAAIVHARKARQELIGKTMIGSYPGIENTPLFAVLQRVMGDRKAERIEYEFTYPDGSVGWFELHVQPCVEGILILSDDITYRKRAERDLANTATQLSLVYDNVSDIIYHLAVEPDDRFRFLSVNPAFLKATGLTEDQVVGKLVQEVIPQPAHALVLGNYKKAIRNKGTIRWEEVSVYPTGTKYGEVSVSPVFDAHGHCISLIGAVHDMTESMLAKEHIETQLKRLGALHDIDLAITASLDLQLVLKVVLEQATTQLRMDAASVLLLSPDTQALTFGAGRGFRKRGIEQTRLRLGEGLAGKAALEQHLVRLGDSAKTQGFTRSGLMESEGFVEYYGAPLVAKGKVNGVLELFHREAFEAEDEWRSFLLTLAGQAAIAIDNAGLFQDLQKTTSELILSYDATIEGWSRALELRDLETEGHTRRVADLAERLAQAMGTNAAELIPIRRGALLHDIGKMGVPDSILLKPGKLTDEEWLIMREHPQYAFDLLSPIKFLRPALDIPYCHHEKWDGSGYPRGLKEELIPPSARIFAVVDVWDALRSDRPYRQAWKDEDALAYIKQEAGTHFDPHVVEEFERHIIGSMNGSGR
ncbi:MAG TPA: HD domain-containing phosphohydrolase [Anaerolineales bacterium]|nr:HD domain-containing phosphohydrolase [Anaerolineales bacterium]